MKKPLTIFIIGFILIAAFSFFVFPTRYHYQEIISWDRFGNQDNLSIRTNYFTGHVDKYVIDRGWVDDH